MTTRQMTADEFVEYLGALHARGFRESKMKGKARTNWMLARYQAYIAGYRVKTYVEAFYLNGRTHPYEGVIRGLRDKDAGLPIVLCPELMDPAEVIITLH